MVRDDYFDWRKTSVELATGKEKIEFVVVMLGVNDVQPLADGSETLGDRWREVYTQRVLVVLATVSPLRTYSGRLNGLPPMRSDINWIARRDQVERDFQHQVEKADEKYTDIWDAFSNQSGQYDAFGPNIDGQSVKLRGADGIHNSPRRISKSRAFLRGGNSPGLENNPQSEVASLPPDIEHAADDINAQIRREMGALPEESEAAPAGAGETLVNWILC